MKSSIFSIFGAKRFLLRSSSKALTCSNLHKERKNITTGIKFPSRVFSHLRGIFFASVVMRQVSPNNFPCLKDIKLMKDQKLEEI